MFKMGGPILYFLLLVLTVSSNPIPDNIYKQLRVSETLLKEDLELILGQEIFDGLMLYFVLVPAKANPAMKERSGKRCSVRASGTGGGKMIPILLTKVVILHMGFTMVEIRELEFERIP